MGDSDDDYDRKRRDKFRGERSAGESYQRSDRRGGDDRARGGREDWSDRPRPRNDFRDYRQQRGDRGYSPGREGPPMKRVRGDWGDEGRQRFGGYGMYGYGHEHFGMHAGGYGHPPPTTHPREQVSSDMQTQPCMLTLKQFLATQDDSISDSDAIQKYNDYKLEFKRQQLNEFFVAHKDEEWFKIKYHPEESLKRREEQLQFLKRRCEVFLELLDSKDITNVTVDTSNSEALLRLLDTVVIKLEGGTDEDLKVLDEKPVEILKPIIEKPKVEEKKEEVKKEDGNENEIAVAGENEEKEKKEEMWDEEEKKDEEIEKVDEEVKADEPKKKDRKKRSRSDSASSSSSSSSSSSDSEDETEKKEEEKKEEEKKKEAEAIETAPISPSLEVKSDEEDIEMVPKINTEVVEEEKKPEEENVAEKMETDETEKKDEEKEEEKVEGEKPEEDEKKEGEKDAEDSEAKKDEKVEETKTETIDLVKDTIPEDDGPRALHKTSSIFLRNLAPSITKAEVEVMCKRYNGFLRVAIADPLLERRWFRRGWVTFKREVNIKEICWNLNNIRLRDCELGAIVNRDLSRRVRPVNGITSHKTIIRSDIKLVAKIAHNLDDKAGLWKEGAEKEEINGASFGLKSKNPVLQNITDYLIEEASAEEEELLGLTTDNKDAIEGELIERDPLLIEVLDKLVLYLRIVHSVDFYNHCEYPYEDEMPNRCGIIHARGPPPQNKVTSNEIQEYIRTFEGKMQSFLAKIIEINEEGELKKLGAKDSEAEIEKFIAANTQELAKDKWLCPLSGKKFKGPDFIRKHIFNKHTEKVDEVKKEVEYFNNYLKDTKRPQLPEHPGNTKKTAAEHQPPTAGFRPAYGVPPGYAGGYGGYGAPMIAPVPRARPGYGRGRIPAPDYRPVIHYRDLDAPREPDEFI